jgi:hypothetical protein
MSILAIKSNAVPFNVRLVRKGDHYGLHGCLQHDDADRPLVEFYDGRFKSAEPFSEHGQLVSRYFASTLLEPVRGSGGLNLCGGVPAWQIDSAGMAEVRRWLTAETGLNS